MNSTPPKPPRPDRDGSANPPGAPGASSRDMTLAERLAQKEAEVAERFFASEAAPAWPASPLQRRMQG